MKANVSVLILCLVWQAFLACKKDPVSQLPSEVSLGESAVYLNGERKDYTNFFHLDTLNQLANYAFVQQDGQITNLIAFDWMPVKSGTYKLHTDRIFYTGALTSFEQSINNDLEGYSYEIEDAEDGFFKVEELDTLTMIAKGRFRAEFCRTSKNNNTEDLKLPKHLVLEGIFYDTLLIPQ